MSYSRRFAFFEKVPIGDDRLDRGIPDIPMTCMVNGGGYLWLGDADGFLHCINSNFYISSFRAHTGGPVRHCRLAPGADHLILTVGALKDDAEERVCVWNTKKWSLTSQTSIPTCCRCFKTTDSPRPAGRNLGQVVCLEVAPTLDIILLGHQEGAVQLIKGDITSDRHCRRLVLHEFGVPVTSVQYVAATPKPQKSNREELSRISTRRISEHHHHQQQQSPDTSVKSLDTGLSPSHPGGAFVFASSENQLVSITLGKKDEPVRTTILDNFGCRPGCSCLLTDPVRPNRPNLVMAHKEAVYFYDMDGRGPCLAIDGDKRVLCSYKNYLAMIKINSPELGQAGAQPEFPNPQSRVSLFEFKNKFIGCDFLIPWAHSIITDFGGLFVLCIEPIPAKEVGSVKIVELIEKDTQSKLDILFSRKSFNLAIGIAESDNYGKEELAHIHRRYADHLFCQKQYDMAVKEYIQTIGTVESSYVVLRFLETGSIHQLTLYLEALHQPEHVSLGYRTNDHTILLLNCYARLDDSVRIDAFIARLSDQLPEGLELDSCINVLRRAGYPKQALALSRLTGHSTNYIQILAEDLKDFKSVISEINSLPIEQALEIVCTHGTFLMQNLPTETAELLDRLCSSPKTGRITAQHFLKIFINNRTGLMKFLERYVQKPHSVDALISNLVETLLELILYETEAVASGKTCDDKELTISHLHGLAMQLLENPKISYDEGKVLILCHQRRFFPGCLFIWKKKQLYTQMLEHYIQENNFDGILNTCNDYGTEDPSLWFEAFKYVSDKPELGDQLPNILTQLEAFDLVSPLTVLKFLTSPVSEKCHKLGSVKGYLLRYLESVKEKVEARQVEMLRLREETLKNRGIVWQSKTRVKIFQQQKCAVCNQGLEPPSIHFLCDHSFHRACFETYSSEDQQCPECAPLIKLRQAEAEKNAVSALPTTGSSSLVLDELKRSLGVGNTVSGTLGELISQGAFQGTVYHHNHISCRSSDVQPCITEGVSAVCRTQSKNPFDVSDDQYMSSGVHSSRSKNPSAALTADSGRADSAPSCNSRLSKMQPLPSVNSADTALVSSVTSRKSAKVSENPFGLDELDTYPEVMNPF